MKYRQQGKEDDALVEELVHGLSGASAGAPEILPEILQGAGSDINRWSLTPLGAEAVAQTRELAELCCTLRKRSAIFTLMRAMLAARVTRRKVLSWSAVLLLTTLFNAFAGSLTTYGQSWLQRSQETLDVETFWELLPLWTGFLLVDLVMDALQNQSTWELRMILQRQASFTLAHALFTADSFYHLQMTMPSAAPEAVICEDAFIFVKQLSEIVVGVLRTFSSFFFSAWILYWYYPKLLWTGIVLTPIFVFVILKSGPYMAEATQLMIGIRAALHFHLSRVQSNAEQIALARGGSSELHECERVLDLGRETAAKQGFQYAVVETIIQFSSLALFLPIIFILVEDMIERGTMISEAVMYFSLCTTVMFGWASTASLMAALLWSEMLAEKMVRMVELSKWHAWLIDTRNGIPEVVTIHEQDDCSSLELRDVELSLGPGSVSLFAGVSFRLAAGESLLVIGETGIGKSMLLRCIQGLWLSGRGSVERCSKHQLACVPQRPFMFCASLRENLLYPLLERPLPDERLREVLEAVNLRGELTAFDLGTAEPWYDILALGQQQRLAFARILLREDVRLLLLDEATSALDLQNERRVYEVMRERFPCYVSAAHRRSVQRYHTHVIALDVTDGEGCRATARFMAAEQCDFGAGGLHVEVLPELEAASGEQGVSDGRRKPVIDGPRIPPPSSMPTLMRRIFFDIIVPIAWRRSFWLRVRRYAWLYALASLLSVITGTAFLLPFAEVGHFATRRDRAGLWSMIVSRAIFFVPVTIFITFVFKYTNFVFMRITIIELQRYFVKRYFDGCMFYRLLAAGRVSDPAGRFTMWDFRAIVEFYLHIVGTLAGALLGNLTLISTLSQADRGEVMPILRIIFVYTLFACVAFITAFLPTYRVFGTWVFEATRLHGNLVHVHGNAEAVAMMQGSGVERWRAMLMLDRCLDSGQLYIWLREYAMPIVTDSLFDRTTKIGLLLLVGTSVTNGNLSAVTGFIVTTVAWKTVEKALSVCNVFCGSPEGFAGLSRIWELVLEMDRLRGSDQPTAQTGGLQLEQDDADDAVLELRSFTLSTPTQLVLLSGISMRLELGQRLAIVGASGVGKSSLLRAVAGLWTCGKGVVRRASDAKSYFVAQRPYVCVGSLRAQVLYPQCSDDTPTERVAEALRAVQLTHLLHNPGLDGGQLDDRWWTRLSLGEVQRLSFARLLLQDGLRVAFLDEATSALSPKAESAMYALLQARLPSFVSVAHRSEARGFHSHVLALVRGGEGPSRSCWQRLEEYELELTGGQPAESK